MKEHTPSRRQTRKPTGATPGEQLIIRVRSLLCTFPHKVEEKKMMGGLVFMVDGHMCCGVKHTTLMARIGKKARAAALEQEHVVPLDIGGGRKPSAFVCVESPGVTDNKALAMWIHKALDFVATLPARSA